MESEDWQARLDRYWTGDGVSLQSRLLQLEDMAAPTSISSTLNKHTHSAKLYPISTAIVGDAPTKSSQSSRLSTASSIISSGSSTSTVTETPYHCGFDLPCEFGFMNCFVQYYGIEYKCWVAHSLAHFETTGKSLPPRKSVCIFCDASFESPSQTPDDILLTWEARMTHIYRHYHNHELLESTKPDFHVIDHLWRNKGMSQCQYDYATSYSERPAHPDLVTLGTKRPQTEKMKEQRSEEKKLIRSQQVQNLAKEERLRKRRDRK